MIASYYTAATHGAHHVII